MAKLRNLLVHHYADIDVEKMYTIIQDNLSDIEQFLQAVKSLLEDPGKLDLEVE